MAKRKRDTESFKKSVEDISVALRNMFYVNIYKLYFVWCLDETKAGAIGQDQHVAAEVQIDDVYLTITLTLYKTLLDYYLVAPGMLFDTILHEFCHVFTDPQYYLAHKFMPDDLQEHHHRVRERQTETIKKVLLGTTEIAELSKLEK